MRLLVVTQYFWPENFRINDLVAGLVERGHEVVVLTGWPNYPEGRIFDDFRKNPRRYDWYEGAKVVRIPMLPRGRVGFQLILNYVTFALSASILGIWRLRGLRFDAIFTCQHSPVTVGIPAAVMRAVKKAPLIFWILDLWPETLRAIGVVRSKLILQLIGKLVAGIYRNCDLILAQSKSFIPMIGEYDVERSRIEYFPNWAESIFDMQDVSPAPEVPLKPGSFNVMFAGNIGDAQDFPAVLAAAESLKVHSNIRWLIVGDGRLAGWVSSEIVRRGLESCVLMLGRYPVERMPSFFKHADALLVSLKGESIFAMTIPGKLQSYLAAGIPVLAMLNGEGAEVVIDARAGLACPAGDHEALANAVLKLSAMSLEERMAMGKNGAATNADKFGRGKLLGQLETWLERSTFGGRHELAKKRKN